MKKVKEVMSPELVSISVNATMAEASELMLEHRIRHLPVTDGHGGIVGILSSKDISIYDRFRRSDVEFFMSSPVLSVHQSTSVKATALKLLENKISCLLVSDDADEAVGIVTTDDLLWYLVENLDQNQKEKSAFFADGRAKETIGQVASRLSAMGI